MASNHSRKIGKTKRKFGNQIPRIDIFVDGNTDNADLLFQLLDEYAAKHEKRKSYLIDWQKLVLRRWLAEDDDGNFANLDCGLAVSRQNGKTEIIVARIVYGIIFRGAVGLFTAQQQDTADVVKKRVQNFFYENDHEEVFNLLTTQFRKKPKNYDFIEFENGASYKFKTRTRLSGLGNTNDELICDEAAEMMDSHQETLLSTTSAARSGNPQTIYVGTPPTAESVGTVFSRNRKEKMAGAKGAWTEWSVEKFTDPADEKAWYDTNPSLGYFLLLPAVEAESRSLSADSFNRMRLGWWSGIEEKRAIKSGVWDACANREPVFDDEFLPVYAVKFSPDRSTYSLVVAQKLIDSRIHCEVVMHKPMTEGFQPLAKWLLERWRNCAKIVIDGVVGQAILIEELTTGQNKIPAKRIITPSMTEIGEAHQFMMDALNRGEFSHYDQPLLNQTVRITKIRPIGRNGAFGWQTMSDQISTSALDAATFGFWGAKTFAKKRKTGNDVKSNTEKWAKILSNW